MKAVKVAEYREATRRVQSAISSLVSCRKNEIVNESDILVRTMQNMLSVTCKRASGEDVSVRISVFARALDTLRNRWASQNNSTIMGTIGQLETLAPRADI